MSEKVISFLENKELVKSLTIEARNKAETFSWEHISEKWVSMFYNGY